VEAQQAHLNLIVDSVFVNILDTNLKTSKGQNECKNFNVKNKKQQT
jgi:hypothetical protein